MYRSFLREKWEDVSSVWKEHRISGETFGVEAMNLEESSAMRVPEVMTEPTAKPV